MSRSLKKYKLCDLEDITAFMSRGVEIAVSHEQQPLEIFFLTRDYPSDSRIYCYKNQCPHTLANLNWQQDQFLNLENSHIQCSMHGALFQISDGVCVWGPCKGQRLQSLDVIVERGALFIKV